MKLRRIIKYAVVSVLILGVAIQFYPVDRSNPPVTAEVPATPEVRSILRRACYDCHSNETNWPWYSYVAPVSWLVAYDVHEGRAELNFSTWDAYSTKDQLKKMHESWEEVAEDEMPPWFYLPAHSDARLSTADRKALRAWSTRS